MTEDLKNPTTVTCPHCGTTVVWVSAAKYKPFCSERCRLIDLGEWLLEKHAIPDSPSPDNQDDAEP